MAKKTPKPKTIAVEIDYIKQIHAEVCQDWKTKLENKFPELRLSPKGKFFIYSDGNISYVILVTTPSGKGMVVKNLGTELKYEVGYQAEWIIKSFEPYTGPKIDLNKVFTNI